MLNFSPLFYLNVLKERGGPISDLKTSRTNIDFYRSGYKTLVKLNEGIVHKKPNFKLYSNWDGTGSDIYLKLSFYKAVSEALERWCYYSVCDDDKYGFDLDKTTNGMAAFPSIFTKTVRENARFEAFERWSILHWWHGYLKNSNIEQLDLFNRVFILSDSINLVTVICFKECPNHRWAYGFSAGKNIEEATKKALIELKRNYDLLSTFREESCREISHQGNIIEKRLLYFSEKEGHQLFLDRIKENKVHEEFLPKLIINEAIKGPWSKYAKVWRCLYAPKIADNSSRADVFLF